MNIKKERIKEMLLQRWQRIDQWQRQYSRPKLALILIGGFIGFLITSFLLLALFVSIGLFGKLPTDSELKTVKPALASEMFSADSVLLGKYFTENRSMVAFENISPHVIHALVATEDSRFYDHKGIDLRSWGRVVVKTLMLGANTGGGSTISQQLAKNLYKRKNYWFFSLPINKMKEMIIARRLEKIYDKKELLKLYLNTVPFSDNAFGIKAAARHFFGVLPKELKKEEAALLIGTLKATTFYNPIKYPERATQRRNIVLKQMEKYGDPPLPKAESDSLQKLALGLNIQKDTNYGGIAGYFKEHLRSEFEELMKDHKKQDGSSYNLYDDGLKIYTTLDSHMQRYAEEAVAEHIKELQKTFDRDWKGVKDELPWTDDKFIEEQIVRSERYKQLKTQNKSDAEIKTVFDTPTEMTVFSWDKGEEVKKMTPRDSIKYYFCLLNAGFVAMNPKNGAILAWVGGTNYKYFQYDCVKAKRQVGSAFKPIVYARAIEKGIDPCTMFPNQLTTYPQYDNWQPENVDKKYGGRYSMEGGIAKSINCVAVEVIMKGGIDSTRILANDMGITSKVRRVPAIALGAVDATLYDMIKVYGTFANGGLRPDIRIIEKIVAQDGTVILDLSTPDATAKYPRIISKHTADVMQHLLTAVVRRGTAEALPLGYGINNIAGKTGTSQSQADGWFIGYTPTVVVGAWVGAPSPAVHFRSEVGQGSRTALPVCGKFLHKVYNDKVYRKKQAEQFPPFGADMDEVLSCPRNDWELQYLIEQDSILIAENGVLVDSAGNVIGAGNGASTRGYYKPELAGKPVEEATDKTKNLKPEKKDSTALKVKNIKSEKKDTIRIEQKR